MKTKIKLLAGIVLIAFTFFMIIITMKNGYTDVAQENTLTNSLPTEEQDNFIEFRDHRIFCIVLTTQENILNKAQTVVDAWASKCDNYILVAILNDVNITNQVPKQIVEHVIEPTSLFMDRYERLTDKVLFAFKYAYLKYPDYDWYLKADDDTFIFADNLRFFLSSKNPNKPVTFGFDINLYVKHGYHSGGAGYVLSREAVNRLGSALNKSDVFCKNTGTEDLDVAVCLRNLDVNPDRSVDEFERERFHPYSLAEHYTGNLPDWISYYAKNPVKTGFMCCSETSISFHYMSPDSIRNLTKIIERLKKHPPLRFKSIIKNLGL